LALTIELQEQLLAWERELDSREITITAWQAGLASFECTLGRACTECDAEHARAEEVR
jgi:hypothetical protein